MICATCGTETVDGRCPTCPPPAAAGPAVRCPKCRASVQKGEKFCDQCGAKIPTRADRVRAMNRSRERQENEKRVNRGRTIMLVVAVLMILAGIVSYFTGMSQVDKEVHEGVISSPGMTEAERDEELKESTGMTWQEMIDQSRGMVKLQTAILVALGVIFLGLWWWAQSNPFGAALSALLLYLTVILISGLVEPASLVKGVIIKILVVVGLCSAVSAGYKERQRRRVA